MTTLYNQIKQPLKWDMGGKTFTCEPWGCVDIPEKLVPACVSRGLPLGSIPVAPETRAMAKVSDEKVAAENDVLRALRASVDQAQAERAAAILKVEEYQKDLGDCHAAIKDLQARLVTATRDLNEAWADKKAAEEIIAEVVQQATTSEERAMKAEALLADKVTSVKHPEPSPPVVAKSVKSK